MNHSSTVGSDNSEPFMGFDLDAQIPWPCRGWTQRHTALYYLQLARVLNPAGASARLAQVDLSSVTSEWENLNELKRFVSTFPVDASPKPQPE